MARPLLDIRAAIDAVDAELAELLNRRAALSLEAGRAKTGGGPVYRPGREAELLSRLKSANRGPMPDSHLEAVYREILSSSRALQRTESVGLPGPEALPAAWRALGTWNDYIPLNGLAEVFAHVSERRCDMGLVPLETEPGGCVEEVAELLARFPVFIRAEFSGPAWPHWPGRSGAEGGEDGGSPAGRTACADGPGQPERQDRLERPGQAAWGSRTTWAGWPRWTRYAVISAGRDEQGEQAERTKQTGRTGQTGQTEQTGQAERTGQAEQAG